MGEGWTWARAASSLSVTGIPTSSLTSLSPVPNIGQSFVQRKELRHKRNAANWFNRLRQEGREHAQARVDDRGGIRPGTFGVRHLVEHCRGLAGTGGADNDWCVAVAQRRLLRRRE